MRKITKSILLLTSAVCLSSSQLSAVTTDVVGYTSTTLPAGAGNLFAPAFVNSNSFVGTLTGATSGTSSTLAVSGDLTPGAFDKPANNPGVKKAYALYYLEVLNDTNASDGLDTEGLIIDITSNTTNGVVVAADISALGIQGNEQVSIRKHLTIGDLVGVSDGFNPFTELLTIYNEDGAGSVVSHLPNSATDGTVLSTDFVTDTSDAPIYPGTGIVINNPSGPVTVVPTGVVKESDTQVAVYGGSVVNIIGVMRPVDNVDLSEDGRLSDALVDFTDLSTQYTADGTLVPVTYASNNGAQPSFLVSGAGFVSASDFTTPVAVSVDGTFEPIVINAGSDTVYKISGITIQ